MKSILIFSAFLYSLCIQAGDRSSLVLRAWVPPALKTRLNQTRLNASTSLLLLSSETNALNFQETQKIEIEGLDQQGLQAEFKLKEAHGRMIQYELLVKHVRTDYSYLKPIVVKISAN